MSRIEDALRKAGDSAPRRRPTTAATPVVRDKPAPGAEYLQNVWTNLQLALVNLSSPIVLFTSALPREGTTTVLYHLSRLVAREKSVLLVDLNFDNPMLHRYYRMENTRGFADVLDGRQTPEEVIQPSGTNNLSILPAGNAAALALQSKGVVAIHQSLERCAKGFDLILVDSPPLRPFPDTALFAAACDGVVLVVRARKTKREVVRYAQTLLDQAEAATLGVVLNRVKFWIPGFIYKRL